MSSFSVIMRVSSSARATSVLLTFSMVDKPMAFYSCDRDEIKVIFISSINDEY